MKEADGLLAELTGGSFREWSREVVTADPLTFDRQAYADRLAALQADDPLAEAVKVGFANIDGHEIAVICSDYEFVAGTLGIAAAERVARAFVVATAARRPVIGICRSGGTRMQEGTPAFVKMLSIGAAISEHREAGLACLSYLMDPAMGGALAAWGTQGHLVWASPGAAISVTGPRVVEAVIGETVPPDEISAEAALERGLIDDIVHPEVLAPRIAEWLSIVESGSEHPAGSGRSLPLSVGATDPHERTDPWRSVCRSRTRDRPSIESVIEAADSPFVEIRGDRTGEDDRGLLAGFVRFGGQSAVAVGFRRPEGRGAQVSPSGYRKAQRAVSIAEELHLPLVSFIDTRGAGVGAEVEAAGLAHAVGTLIRELLGVRIPTVSVLVGEGSGAGAIALIAADAMIALEHAWLAPIDPEAASAILFRNTEAAAQMARGQAADVAALRDEGIVDTIVPEAPTVEQTSAMLADAVADALRRTSARPPDERLLARRAGIRSLARRHLTIRDPAPSHDNAWRT
ncbi:MAG: hypothetical protein OXC00_02695 [Acidimicrobiaceae bacterium]|nr:hypothetical protein [Acidimicrobiaceae bacterium]